MVSVAAVPFHHRERDNTHRESTMDRFSIENPVQKSSLNLVEQKVYSELVFEKHFVFLN